MNWFQYMLWLMRRNTKGPAVPSAPTNRPSPVPGSVFDDFDGPEGSIPDPELWAPINGYTQGVGMSSAADVALDGDSNLVVSATQTGAGWTMGWLATYGKQSFGYGTFSASMKMPPGHGLDPAFWLLGPSCNPALQQPENNWPACGEIDIIEQIGDGKYYNTIHGPMYNDGDYAQAQVSGVLEFDPSAGFHTYWMNHVPGKVTFGVDATTTAVVLPKYIPAGAPWVCDQPFNALFGIGVGGWPGNPDATTPNPANMLVDWFYFEPSP